MRTLVDHEEILGWAQERGARPFTGRRTNEDDSVGIMGLNFPGSSDERSLEEIGWEEWFRDFDENDLALIVRDEIANGHSSNFHKLVARENLEDDSPASSTRGEKKKAPSGTLTSARSTKTSGQRSGKAAVPSKRAAERQKRDQHSERNITRHKPRRKAA